MAGHLFGTKPLHGPRWLFANAWRNFNEICIANKDILFQEKAPE